MVSLVSPVVVPPPGTGAGVDPGAEPAALPPPPAADPVSPEPVVLCPVGAAAAAGLDGPVVPPRAAGAGPPAAAWRVSRAAGPDVAVSDGPPPDPAVTAVIPDGPAVTAVVSA